jgi:hypothetical protein
MGLYETPSVKGTNMNVAEIFIAHVLYGNPGMLHVTADGEKLYFLLEGHLMFVDAPKGTSYSNMTDAELNVILQDALNERMNSH